MSRSVRKKSVSGVTAATSDKFDKQKANRALRRLTKVAMQESAEDKVLPVTREVRDIWSTAKEGKLYFDPALSPKRMRK